MIYVFHINSDDKENGLFPPYSCWKIHVNARGWTSNPQDSKPTYDQAEHFLRFPDKYVSHAVGNHYYLQWSKTNRSKTFLDTVTASDIAYTILVYENTKEVWEKACRSRQATRLRMRGIMQCIIKKTKYHVRRGKHLKRFGDGWTDNRQEYYQELLRIFKELKPSDVWNALQDHWKCIKRKITPEMIIKLRN